MVCKTIRDGSNPSVHLRSVCKTSASLLLEHAGLWILEYRFKSDGRCVSFVQRKGQGTSNPPIQVRILYETSGYVAKRLCTGLLTRDTQVRLLSYPSFFIPTITVGFFCLDQIFHLSITLFPAFLLLPFQQEFISFSSRRSSQINKQHENDPFSFSFTCKKFGIDEGGMTVHPSRHP